MTQPFRSEAEAVFRKEHDMLLPKGLAYARKWFKDPAVAEDVVQEALIQMWETWYEHGEAPESPLKAFFRILRRRAVDESRRRESITEMKEQHVIDITNRIQSRQGAALLTEGSALLDRIQKHLAELPVEQQVMFEAVLKHETDVRAASDALGISYDTARWQWSEARKKLRTRLERDGYDVPALRPRGRAGGRRQKPGEMNDD